MILNDQSISSTQYSNQIQSCLELLNMSICSSFTSTSRMATFNFHRKWYKIICNGRGDHLITDLMASKDLSNISLKISNALTQAPPATGALEPSGLSGLPYQSDVSSVLLNEVLLKSERPPCPLTCFMRWKNVKVSAQVGGTVMNIRSHFRYLPLIAERQALYEITLGSSCCSYAWVTLNLTTHSGEHDETVASVTTWKIERERDTSYSYSSPINYRLQMTKVCGLRLCWLWHMQFKYMAQLGKRRRFTALQAVWHSSSHAA